MLSSNMRGWVTLNWGKITLYVWLKVADGDDSNKYVFGKGDELKAAYSAKDSTILLLKVKHQM